MPTYSYNMHDVPVANRNSLQDVARQVRVKRIPRQLQVWLVNQKTYKVKSKMNLNILFLLSLMKETSCGLPVLLPQHQDSGCYCLRLSALAHMCPLWDACCLFFFSRIHTVILCLTNQVMRDPNSHHCSFRGKQMPKSTHSHSPC